MSREKLTANETELSKNIYEHGVDNKCFATIPYKSRISSMLVHAQEVPDAGGFKTDLKDAGLTDILYL